MSVIAPPRDLQLGGEPGQPAGGGSLSKLVTVLGVGLAAFYLVPMLWYKGGVLVSDPTVMGSTPLQMVMAIPKATSEAHLRENLAAAAVVLDDSERAAIDRAFPPPRRKTPLTMI